MQRAERRGQRAEGGAQRAEGKNASALRPLLSALRIMLPRAAAAPLRKIAPRRAQYVPARRRDRDRSPLIRHRHVGVKEHEILLTQFRGDAVVHVSELVLTLD